jgi:hypothetical protein
MWDALSSPVNARSNRMNLNLIVNCIRVKVSAKGIPFMSQLLQEQLQKGDLTTARA